MNLLPFGRRREPRASVLEKIYAQLARPKVVLFVDDNDMMREYFERVVSQRFSVYIVTAATTEEARTVLQDMRVDAVILDWMLAQETTLELYREIVGKWPNMEVCFLTGRNEDAVRGQIEDVGCARVFSKDRIRDLDFVGRLFTQWHVHTRPPFPA